GGGGVVGVRGRPPPAHRGGGGIALVRAPREPLVERHEAPLLARTRFRAARPRRPPAATLAHAPQPGDEKNEDGEDEPFRHIAINARVAAARTNHTLRGS